MRTRHLLWTVPLLVTGCMMEKPDESLQQNNNNQNQPKIDAGARDSQVVVQEPQPDAAPPPDAAPDAAVYTCTGGAANVTDNGHCYMYFLTPKSATEARAQCTALGGKTHLVSITSQLEQNKLAMLVGQQDVWIGLGDAATEGTFVWDSMEPLGFTYWAAGEPNGGAAANCVALKANAFYLWADRACTDQYQFICERDP